MGAKPLGVLKVRFGSLLLRQRQKKARVNEEHNAVITVRDVNDFCQQNAQQW